MSTSAHPPKTAHDQQQERQLDLMRLRTSLGYLALREIHLLEYKKATEEWMQAKLEKIPALQARAIALLEVLEMPDSLYKKAGGEGRVFDKPGGGE